MAKNPHEPGAGQQPKDALKQEQPPKPNIITSVSRGIGKALESEETQDRLVDLTFKYLDKELGLKERDKKKGSRKLVPRIAHDLLEFTPIIIVIFVIYIAFKLVNYYIP